MRTLVFGMTQSLDGYIAGARPALRLVAMSRVGEDAVGLSYVPLSRQQ